MQQGNIMGSLFHQGGLTQPGSALVTPSTGQPSMIGSPDQITAMEHRLRNEGLQSAANNPVMAPKPQAPFQVPGQPSFQQAATAGAMPGGANVLSPGLNKAGKLVTLLTSGLQGALAGRAASEQTVAATGGRRSGGAGMGFEAGYTLPWQRQAQQNQLAQQQAQIEATRAQSQMIQTPNGPIPAWLAKTVMPAQIRGEATTEAAGIGAGGRTKAAQIGAEARIKAALMGLGPLAKVPQELQDQFGLPAELPLKMLNQAEGAANRPLTVVAGENDSYLINRQNPQQKTPLGVGNRGAGAVNAGLVPIVDPTNPGIITYSRRGNAVGKQSPQGAPTTAAKAEARSEVPTKIGDQKVAFSTAIQHADLLKKAFDSVQNSDVQAWNSIKNRVKTEFGWAEPPTAQLIAEVYAGEINKIINAGHITQQELEKVGGTVPANYASPGRMAAALSAYKALAQSKLDNLVKQANAAKGGGSEIHYHIENGQLVPNAASPK